ncbi:hypothetical protein [Nonomuraea rhizosphaerae]|uniref:hypothetical protein n=1 Tax=Nonomuraea rhizosphaerae TaxID=2665663 RepID=UPI001C5D381E|nr:hypothetical protein [Nonomuraea rhizosphaerae]
MPHFDEAAVDRMIAESQQSMEGLDEVYQQVLAVQGFAQDPEKLVTVECSSQGVTGLEINPRALRWGAQRLSATILELIGASLADMEAKSAAIMAERWGEAPMSLTDEGNPAQVRLQEAQDAYDRAMDDAMAQIARIERRLDGA